MKVPLSCYLSLVFAGLGQTILLAFAWGFLAAVWLRGPLPLPYSAANFVFRNPTGTMLIVTVIGTVLAQWTTWTFSLTLGVALEARVNSPTSLVNLTAGIALARCERFFHRRYIHITLFSIVLFLLASFMGALWSTFIDPTFVTWDIHVEGSELDLDSTYFNSQLGAQLLSSGSALPADHSLEIIENYRLLSGIATAQQSVGIAEMMSFNGVSYYVSTGGVLPAIQGVGSIKSAEQNNTGLNFVGGRASGGIQPPSERALMSSYIIIQQGLTADVTCSQITSDAIAPPQTALVPVDIFTGNVTYLVAYAYNMSFPQGNAAQQDYVISTTTATNLSSGNLLASLVCPYPVWQAGLDWSSFYVTSQGIGKYQFLRSTTCRIIPKLTRSMVTYDSNTLNVTTLSSTPLSARNANMSLFLASILQYQTGNSQGLGSNSIGDALYSTGAFTDIVSDGDATLSAGLIKEMEQYWRGIIEFFGTYLRSGFSAYPLNVPSEGQVAVSGNFTVTTMGWSKTKPVFLYTVIPITLFALCTYAAIGYALYALIKHTGSNPDEEYATFNPMDPLHLIAVSSSLGRHYNPEESGTPRIRDLENLRVRITKSGSTGAGLVLHSGGLTSSSAFLFSVSLIACVVSVSTGPAASASPVPDAEKAV